MKSAVISSLDCKAVSVSLLPSKERALVADIWGSLETRLANDSIVCSWDWTETWLKYYGDLVPHYFAVGECAGNPCGIALVSQGVDRRCGPFKVRSRHLGTAGEPDADSVCVEYNRLLVAPENRDAFATALVAAIRQEIDWDELLLDGFALEDAEPLLRAEPSFVAERRVCRAVDLRTAGELGGDIITALKANTQKKIRRSLRGFGSIQTEWADTVELAMDILNELIDLHQQRWEQTGKPGSFASARFIAFHRELVPRLFAKGAIILFRARSASGTIGCLYSFSERGRILFYQSGLATVDDNKLKPGLVTHALCMQGCMERGFTEYNFLAGDSRYKQELSTMEQELVWASARQRRMKFFIVDTLRRARQRMRGKEGSCDVKA
jgi:CelD/BcsL family acetyltransferase involved in cellulose biosynthesis